MPPVGFEPMISAGERPQTYALDRAATGTGRPRTYLYEKCFAKKLQGKIKRTVCTQYSLAYELNKQKTANVCELLRNANLSYMPEFLKVSLDEVDASSRAQMTNNAYHVPSALCEV